MRKLSSGGFVTSVAALSLVLATVLALLAAALLVGTSWGTRGAFAQYEPTASPTASATPAAAANTLSATPTVNPDCDLQISKYADRGTAAEGGQITYTIAVNNGGSGQGGCTDLTVDDVIPANTDCVDASVDPSSDISSSNFDIVGCDTSGTVEWTTDSSLGKDEQVVLTMVVDLTTSANEGDMIINEACATSASDVDGGCDTASTTVGPSGSISGTVTDAQHNPLEGCSVVVWSWGGAGSDHTGNTGADGHYTVTGLTTGSYGVDVGCDGYVHTYYNNTWNADYAMPVSVVEGQNTPGINFSLQAAGTISGTVTDGQGNPLEGCQVAAEPWAGGADIYGNTDAEGDYSNSGLPSGNYRVFDECSGYAQMYYDGAYDSGSATSVHVAQGQVTGGIDFALEPSGSISGTIVDGAGHPIDGADVQACPPEGDYCGWATSAADGTYTITDLDYLTFTVYAAASGYAQQYYQDVSSSEDATPVGISEAHLDATGIDIHLIVGGSISGVVRDGQGSALSGIYVNANPPDNSSGVWLWALTAADGSYTIADVPPGPYHVWTMPGSYAPEYYISVRWPEDATSVQVASGEDTPNIDFVLDGGGSISGVVTGAGGHPVAGARVNASPVNRTVPWWWSLLQAFFGWSYATTTADGTYTITALPAASYQVWMQDTPAYLTKYYDGVFVSTQATPVTVTEGADTSNINFGATARVLGDARRDGQLSMTDAMFIAQVVARLRSADQINPEMANVNYCQPNDQGVTMVDAMLIARKVAGLASFPCPLPTS